MRAEGAAWARQLGSCIQGASFQQLEAIVRRMLGSSCTPRAQYGTQALPQVGGAAEVNSALGVEEQMRWRGPITERCKELVPRLALESLKARGAFLARLRDVGLLDMGSEVCSSPSVGRLLEEALLRGIRSEIRGGSLQSLKPAAEVFAHLRDLGLISPDRARNEFSLKAQRALHLAGVHEKAIAEVRAACSDNALLFQAPAVSATPPSFTTTGRCSSSARALAVLVSLGALRMEDLEGASELAGNGCCSAAPASVSTSLVPASSHSLSSPVCRPVSSLQPLAISASIPNGSGVRSSAAVPSRLLHRTSSRSRAGSSPPEAAHGAADR